MTWNYVSPTQAKCGVDGCGKQFFARQEWVKHCKKAHPAYYKENLASDVVEPKERC